ncbi:lytic transglycosylase domain-containing protein [Inquilinus sp. Marseille-Q2685]|uniref:lytic transglycosylase domain-containing protein n=1 Tax=Inquilinus sp. Marseille-Q2685 TaxID=2866581 RepID=UPI001CE3B60D|nr:lytic transglycosylase domain-containing protein [Inquilinus sp. Marseille-Q2685]
MAAAAVAALALLPGPASAGDCMARAALQAGVPTELILAMSYVETRWRQQAVNASNSNGSEDVCMMQINSIHYPRLAALGVTRDALLADRCVCLLVGGEILREMRAATGGDDIWSAVAAYNAGPDNLAAGRPYADQVRRVYEAIHVIQGQ